MASILIFIALFGYEFTILELVGGFALVIGGTAGLLKNIKDIRVEGWIPVKTKWLNWFSRGRQNAKDIGDLKDLMTKTVDGVEVIKAELRTNGGQSLKDVVNATGAVVQKIQARIDHKDEYDPQPIFHLDANGNLCFANCAFRELFDADDRELSHRNYISLIASAHRQRFLAELNDAITNKMPLNSTVEVAAIGTMIQILATANVVSGGELRGFIGTASRVKQ